MRRLALALAGLVAVAAAAIAWFVVYRLDAVVAREIERQGSAAMGTSVRVTGVDLELRAARGTIRGLTVANPPGFSHAPAFSLEAITLRLDPAALRADPIVVEELRVGAPRVRFELDEQGLSNLEALRSRMDRAEAGSVDAPPGGQGRAARLRVRELELEPGVLTIDASAFGREPRELRLRGIELHEVGRARGASSEEIARTVAEAIVARTLRAVAAAETSRALENFGGALGRAIGDAIGRGIEGPGGDTPSRE
jgi:uncharacterized protein involved in outer membrane biogenesis